MKDLYNSRKDGWYYYTWGINFRYVTFWFFWMTQYSPPFSAYAAYISGILINVVGFAGASNVFPFFWHYRVLIILAKLEELFLWPRPVSTKCPSSPASAFPPPSITSSTDSSLSLESPPNSRRSTFRIMLLSVATTIRRVSAMSGQRMIKILTLQSNSKRSHDFYLHQPFIDAISKLFSCLFPVFLIVHDMNDWLRLLFAWSVLTSAF